MTRVTQGIERDGYASGFLVDLFPVERLMVVCRLQGRPQQTCQVLCHSQLLPAE